MEWKLTVNDLLPDTITKLNSTLSPPGFHGDLRSLSVIQGILSTMINELGEKSSSAQGLGKVITTAEKLRNSPSHFLYLIKDAKANGGEGELIGMLKVGRKHLYLFDSRDQVCEVEPLCVLDFFVLDDRQRSGYGRMLFDYMLQDLETSPHEMPVDGPSANMERFLCKNYGMADLVRQNNNFAISPHFFHDKGGDDRRGGRGAAGGAAGGAAVGRFGAPKPPSVIGGVIHGDRGYHDEPNQGLSWTERMEASVAAAVAYVGNEWDLIEDEMLGSAATAMLGNEHPLTEAERELEPAVAHELPRSPSRPRSLPAALASEPVAVNAGSGAGTAASADPDADPSAGAEAKPAAAAGTPSAGAGAGAERHDSQLTDRGYFDVKFYHNKLW